VTTPNWEPSDRHYGASPATPPDVEPTLVERRPRRKRRGRRWLIALLVLIALVVAADRVGVVVAEGAAASKIQKQQNLSQKPSVSIGGFPFLTQVASRDFSHITVDIHGLVADGVPISDVHADLTGVHVASNYNSATADTLVATAEVSYADLSAYVSKQAADIGQVTISRGTDGKLKASMSILSFSVSAQVSVTLLANNTIEVKSGAISTPLSGLGLTTPQGFDYKIGLGTLPFGIQLGGLDFTGTGIQVSATAHNIPLSNTTSVK
jgi:hypothetical protein